MSERMIRPNSAAKALGSNGQSVRVRMQRGLFEPPIGTVCNLGGGSRYTYEIYPERLAAYLGVSVDEVFRRIDADDAPAATTHIIANPV